LKISSWSLVNDLIQLLVTEGTRCHTLCAQPRGLFALHTLPYTESGLSDDALGSCLIIGWYIEERNVNVVETSRWAHVLFYPKSGRIVAEAFFEDYKHDTREEVVE